MGTESTIGDNSNVEVDYAELQKFLDEMTNKSKTVAEANGNLRSHLKSVLSETGWHKGAVAMIRQIDSMSETGRADFLRTFDPMFEAMYQNRWKDEAQDMFVDNTETEPAK